MKTYYRQFDYITVKGKPCMQFKRTIYEIAISLLCSFLLPTVMFAEDAVQAVSREDVTYLTYRYADQTYVPSIASQNQQILFNNTVDTGLFYLGATPDTTTQDWGTSPGGLISSFQIGYGTPSTEPVNVTITFYTGTTDADIGNVIAIFNLPDLPGSSSGQPETAIINVDLSDGGEFELPPGIFGYGYQIDDDDSGPIIAIGGTGITDAFRDLPDPALHSFGGNPFAQFWMQIGGEVNLPAPINLQATAGNGMVVLAWQQPGADVEKSPFSGGWIGSTSQDLPLGFHVTDQGNINVISMPIRISFGFPINLTCTIIFQHRWLPRL